MSDGVTSVGRVVAGRVSTATDLATGLDEEDQT